jgi:hypothetical protein
MSGSHKRARRNNMGARVAVRVSQEHSSKGQRRSTSSCPFALAIQAKYGEKASDVTVGGHVVCVYLSTGRKHYFKTSRRMRRAIKLLDDIGEEVEPGLYYMQFDREEAIAWLE